MEHFTDLSDIPLLPGQSLQPLPEVGLSFPGWALECLLLAVSCCLFPWGSPVSPAERCGRGPSEASQADSLLLCPLQPFGNTLPGPTMGASAAFSNARLFSCPRSQMPLHSASNIQIFQIRTGPSIRTLPPPQRAGVNLSPGCTRQTNTSLVLLPTGYFIQLNTQFLRSTKPQVIIKHETGVS